MTKHDLPDLEEFLDFIDPNKEIDRKKAFLEISLISSYAIFRKSAQSLNEIDRITVEKLLEDAETMNLRPVFSIFEKAGHLDDLFATIEKTASDIKLDYMKTQIDTLTQTLRENLFKKYPQLRDI